MLAEVTEPENLTPLQFGVLAALDDEPGIDQRRLAARLAIDPVTAGQVINDLERASLVDRQVHSEDRRARVLGLTPDGLKLRRRLRPALAAAQSRILAPLSAKDQATLLTLLTRVVAGNEAYAKPGNGRRRPGQKLVTQKKR
jgi:DNA-binding MarR family transcriptional regulator